LQLILQLKQLYEYDYKGRIVCQKIKFSFY